MRPRPFLSKVQFRGDHLRIFIGLSKKKIKTLVYRPMRPEEKKAVLRTRGCKNDEKRQKTTKNARASTMKAGKTRKRSQSCPVLGQKIPKYKSREALPVTRQVLWSRAVPRVRYNFQKRPGIGKHRKGVAQSGTPKGLARRGKR